MNDIVEALETKLMKKKLTSLKQSTLNFDETSSIFYSLKQCWDVDTFIPELTHNFLQLSLQIFQRTQAWIHSILGNIKVEKGLDHINERDLVVLYGDVSSIHDWVTEASFLPKLGGKITLEVHNILKSTLSASSLRHRDFTKEATISHAIHMIADKCTSPIGPSIKSITNTYRFSQKEEPTESLEYAKNILSPLGEILHDPMLKLNQIEKDAIASQVIERSVASFDHHAIQFITSVQKTQEFLNKKKGKREQIQAASDTHKMFKQLQFDVQELKMQIQNRFGLEPSEFQLLRVIEENVNKTLISMDD